MKYLDDNADGIRRDWPRVPLPAGAALLETSADFGREVARLLDVDSPVAGVDSGDIRPELRVVGVMKRVGGGPIDPAAGELGLAAGWGRPGRGGVCMPGKGRLEERAFTGDELAAIGDGASELGIGAGELLDLWGGRCVDVYLNDVAYWSGVPVSAWEFYIGGYQVMKKWLSYRERDALGRDLSMEEADYVRDMGRRISALLLLGPRLDCNYESVKSSCYPWRV